jgi:hypothetical protein
VAVSPFTTRSNVFDEAFRAGERPGDKNQLGSNPTAITDPKDFANAFIKNSFTAKSKEVRDSAIFSQDTATVSQKKIDLAASTDMPGFQDPSDNQFAFDFLQKYSGPGGAIEKGLVNPEDAVTKEKLARLVTQPANFGSNERDPNTVNKFPGAGGVKI